MATKAHVNTSTKSVTVKSDKVLVSNKTPKILEDVRKNSDAIAYSAIAEVMLDILNSTNEEGKRQLSLTIAMFNLPSVFTFAAAKKVLVDLEKEAKTIARHNLMKALCNDYSSLLTQQEQYNAIKGKKSDEQVKEYLDRRLRLDAMDKMVTLALTGIYFLRHPDNKVQALELKTKGKRFELDVLYIKGSTKGADGKEQMLVESKSYNAAELTKLGRDKLPSKGKGVPAGKKIGSNVTVVQKPIAENLPIVSHWLATEATKVPMDKGLEDMPVSVKQPVMDILKTYLPLEFGNRTDKTFDGNAFVKYVTDVLKLKFEYTEVKPVVARTNGKTKVA